MLLIIFLICILCSDVSCFSYYLKRIPNGRNVKNPCDPKGMWRGVGHWNSKGGGKNNPFGEDFKKEGNQWTRRLCFKDSDNDGKHNGLELGDPWCRWTQKNNIRLLTKISHPGICEPMDSARCLRSSQHLPCSKRKQSECKAMRESGVIKHDLLIPSTRVPTKETTFACMIYNLPRDKDYHIVAMEPITQNRDIVHHFVVYGCDTTYEVGLRKRAFECDNMPPSLCEDPIMIVSAGLETTCLNPEAGFLIGKNGYRQVLMQIHWNNPDNKANFIDNSGVSIYYTSKLRKYNAGAMALTSIEFTIPPKTPAYVVQTTCPDHCTSSLINKPVIISQALNHMHLIGKKQKIELIRKGKVVRYITNDENYKFLDPQVYTFKEPLRVYPGDTLKTTCEYNSMNRSKPVPSGFSSYEEMCAAVLTYYPKEAWKSKICASYKNIPLCTVWTTGKIKDCDIEQFRKMAKFYRSFTPVLTNCAKTGKCSSTCLMATKVARKHRCMKGEMYHMWKSLMEFNKRVVYRDSDPVFEELLNAFVACEAEYDRTVPA